MKPKPIIKTFTHKLNVMKFEQWTDPENPPKDVKLIKKGFGEFNHRPCKVGDWFSKKTCEFDSTVIIPNKEFKKNFVEVIGEKSKGKIT
jgi:hypothetical protein